jgi:hypothetical protein
MPTTIAEVISEATAHVESVSPQDHAAARTQAEVVFLEVREPVDRRSGDGRSTSLTREQRNEKSPWR